MAFLRTSSVFGLCACVLFIVGCVQQPALPTTYTTNGVTLTWLGHASFRIMNSDTTVYVDPFVIGSQTFPADFILLTHDHPDHCAVNQAKLLAHAQTRIIGPLACITKMTGLTNSIVAGEFFAYPDYALNVSAYPAYNLNSSYHPPGSGVGLLIDLNGTRVYHAGDTDAIPEFAALADQHIDVLLLPIGGTYTMDVQGAADAARMIKPRVVIPMHFNSERYGISNIPADPQELSRLLAGSGIEVVVLQPAVVPN